MQPLMNQATTPETIQDGAGLVQLCERLRGADAIGLDTEFLRERTYFAQLCLLQLSVADHAWCVDTLALRDLSALRATLAIILAAKVLHAARQDLEVLWPATGAVTGLFDTQVAAALIGLPAQIGYGELVQRLLSTTLHKAETRTDWSRRPLSAAQLEYALDDVRYLLPLRDRLQARLQQLGRWQWFLQEMAELDAIGSFDVDPQTGVATLQGLQRARSGAPAARRGARRAGASSGPSAADRPRNWILPDAALRDIVLRAPRTLHELEATDRIHRRHPSITAVRRSWR